MSKEKDFDPSDYPLLLQSTYNQKKKNSHNGDSIQFNNQDSPKPKSNIEMPVDLVNQISKDAKNKKEEEEAKEEKDFDPSEYSLLLQFQTDNLNNTNTYNYREFCKKNNIDCNDIDSKVKYLNQFQKQTDNKNYLNDFGISPEIAKKLEEDIKKKKENEEKEAKEKQAQKDELEQNMILNSGDREISYVTRGAMMRCSKGSHGRRLDILVDHGFEFEENLQYEHPYPLMTEEDWILETDDVARANIKKFGICHSTLSKPNTEMIHLVSEEGHAIDGLECDLQIVHCWYKTQVDASLCDRPLLTMESFLFCKHCGMIQFETNGSEYEGQQDLPTFKSNDK